VWSHSYTVQVANMLPSERSMRGEFHHFKARFSYSQRLDLLWAAITLLSKEQDRLFSPLKQLLKLTAYFHLLLRLDSHWIYTSTSSYFFVASRLTKCEKNLYFRPYSHYRDSHNPGKRRPRNLYFL